jgi:NADP-dependent 3-hydroxy acid dehydrogenase YdfG
MADKGLVVITGASSGIGEATAKAFHAAGYPLLLLARRLDRMQALKLSNTLCVAADVTDIEAMRAAITAGEAKFGPVDTLINNAGVMLLGKAEAQPLEHWQRMVNVNITGLLNATHLVLDGMVTRNRGTVVNIGSVAGRKTGATAAVYNATKFGVHAMSEAMREQLAPSNVRVIVIAPGIVKTELVDHNTDDIKGGYQGVWDQIGEMISADDIAKSILWTCQQPQHICIREVVLASTKQQR